MFIQLKLFFMLTLPEVSTQNIKSLSLFMLSQQSVSVIIGLKQNPWLVGNG